MSDLISRESVIETLKQSGIITDNDLGNLVVEEIERIPTAYDVDKVVEQLEEARDELLHSTDYNNDIINYCLDWFDMAIDIVKGAVKDE